MARKHYWQFLVTDEGNPIENAQITVYRAGTTDPVWVYTDEQGTSGSDSNPQITTSLKGYFEFWIADQSDPTHGYELSTKFKVGWIANGVSDGYIDNIDVFSTFIEPVDETSTDELKNKALSNLLAYTWEAHRMASLPADSVHGIDPVDISPLTGAPTPEELQEDGDLNKVYNNYMGRLLDDHARYQWDGTPDNTTLNGALPERVHGIEQVDETQAVPTVDKNKLVSNSLSKSWTDHLSDATDPHPQYMPVTGDTGTYPNNFTGLVGYSSGTIVNGAGVDDFITKAYVDNHRYSVSLSAIGWTDNGDGTYYKTVTHNLGVSYPMVIVWRTFGTPDQVVQPEAIEHINTNSIKITVSTVEEFFVRVMV